MLDQRGYVGLRWSMLVRAVYDDACGAMVICTKVPNGSFWVWESALGRLILGALQTVSSWAGIRLSRYDPEMRGADIRVAPLLKPAPSFALVEH